MEYKFTIVFGELRDFEQANEYMDKLTEFIDKELTEEWCAFGERVENARMVKKHDGPNH